MYTHRLIFLLCLSLFFLTRSSAQHLKVETWYDSKKLALKESFYVLKRNPKVQDSLYTSYYQNGNVKSIGHYTRNKASGWWEYFYENGNLKMRGELKDNVSDGNWEYYYENGGLNMEGIIDNGMREGEWKFYYENGNLKTVGEYQENKKEGLWTYFQEDGTFKAQAFFQKDKGKYTELYPNGSVKVEGVIVDGKSNGIWKYYYENGNIKAEGEERNGAREGFWKFYHSNGKLASEGAYVKGKEQGHWNYYYDNGNLSAEGENVEGVKDGRWKLYYPNGTFKAEGNFQMGSGSYKEYYESKKLKIEGYIKQGKNEGEWTYYYENGALEGKCTFTDGKGHYTGYYENMNLKMEGMIEDGMKTGIWKLYHIDGAFAGQYKTYYEGDVPVFIPLQQTTRDSIRRDSIRPVEKPDLKLPKKKSRHYTRKVNEYKDFILSMQPLGLLRNKLSTTFVNHFPVSLEYYYQERLGFEVSYSLLRDPFFREPSGFSKRGFSAYFRQKLYQKDQDNGMFYWGQELRFTSLDYFSSDINSVPSSFHTNEKLYEFSLIFGDRLLRDARKRGWTIDIYAGLGIGYRDITHHNAGTNVFPGLNTRRFTVPFRFGLSAGYLF